MPSKNELVTIERFIVESQKSFPDASGTLTQVLQDIALAGKIIARRTNRAGLADILGQTGSVNVQGEKVHKLDEYSQDIFYRVNASTGRVCALVSEEEEDIVYMPDEAINGKYIIHMDPLDGSSNIDVNVSVGTVFAVYRRKSEKGKPTKEDIFQSGRDVVAAGYIVYGSSTMFVYSAGHGVHGFTLDPSIGEFLLSHPNINIPAEPKYFSTNTARVPKWSKGIQEYTQWLLGENGGPKKLSLRYIGSMVSDIHRNLLTGGVFYYPADEKAPQGKLRLLYEAIPMAYLIEQAGGHATNGVEAILDITPTELHQRTPLFIGNKELVDQVKNFLV